MKIEGQGQKARNKGMRKCTGAQTVIEDAFFKKFEDNMNGIGWPLK